MVANKMCNVNLNVVQRKSSQTIINHQRKLTIHFQVSDTVAVNIHKGVVDMLEVVFQISSILTD